MYYDMHLSCKQSEQLVIHIAYWAKRKRLLFALWANAEQGTFAWVPGAASGLASLVWGALPHMPSPSPAVQLMSSPSE